MIQDFLYYLLSPILPNLKEHDHKDKPCSLVSSFPESLTKLWVGCPKGICEATYGCLPPPKDPLESPFAETGETGPSSDTGL